MPSNVFYLLTLSIGFSSAVIMLIYILFSKNMNSNQFYLGNTKGLDPKVARLVNMVGGDLLAVIPKSVQRKALRDKKIEGLFRASGNPWGVTKLEFLAIRVTYAFLLLIVVGIMCVILRPPFILTLPLILLVSYLGWAMPVSKYKSVAKARSTGFKRNLPELLDYLTMVMGDGTYTLPNAIKFVLPHLEPSVVKEEFEKVVDAIDAGSTTESALNELSGRVPSAALESFVKAVNNANKLNTPMDALMRTRAESLRQDLINEIEMVIQTLPTKTMVTVGPPAIFSLIVIFMTPVIVALIDSL